MALIQRCLLKLCVLLGIVCVGLVLHAFMNNYLETKPASTLEACSCLACVDTKTCWQGHNGVYHSTRHHFQAKAQSQRTAQPETMFNALLSTTEEPLLNDADLNYTKRRHHIRYVCDNIEKKPTKKPVDTTAVLASQLWHIPSLDIIYCPLNEDDVPSWTHNLDIWLQDENYRRSHSNTNSKMIEGVHGKYLWHTEMELQNALKTSLKVFFSENPYWQLFRFYVNNFLSPSKQYLEIGKEIISKFKESPSLKNKQCGHNVTFQEFARFVKSTPYNRKWAGIIPKCDLCSVRYDIVGKEESFLQDMANLYSMIRPDRPVPHLSDIQSRYDRYEIESIVRRAFARKNEIVCLSDHSILRRMWRQLQIWGYISIGMKYPYSARQSKKTEYPVMLNKVLRAYDESRNITSSNKIDAFTLAFHQLTFNDVDQVRRIYRNDFIYMAENDHPARVFFKQGPKPEFEYFDVISSY